MKELEDVFLYKEEKKREKRGGHSLKERESHGASILGENSSTSIYASIINQSPLKGFFLLSGEITVGFTCFSISNCWLVLNVVQFVHLSN